MPQQARQHAAYRGHVEQRAHLGATCTPQEITLKMRAGTPMGRAMDTQSYRLLNTMQLLVSVRLNTALLRQSGSCVAALLAQLQ